MVSGTRIIRARNRGAGGGYGTSPETAIRESGGWRGWSRLARTGVVLSTAAAVLAAAPLLARTEDGAVIVLGEEISLADLAAARDERARAVKLYDFIWQRISRHYIGQKELAATGAEMADFANYHREFERKDRAQRGRKLVELNQRLAADGLESEERARLEEFRAVLTRLAQHDAEQNRLPPPDPVRQAALSALRIELWKMNGALYQQYGGVVALTPFGPDPQGARATLIAEYESRGLLRFADAGLRTALFSLLESPPSMTVPPERVDFTPYWKLPIPPSYFPD